MSPRVQIGTRWVGHDRSVYVIAEAGLNHGGNIDIAIKMIEAAARAGADAIKFQAFETENRFGSDEETKALVRPAEFNKDQFCSLADVAKDNRIDFLSTAFDEEKVDMLAALNVPAIKVASCDIGNYDLLRKLATTRLPVIMSRGTASRNEIDTALEIFQRGKLPHVLLHCVSSYPLKDEDANLRAIHSLRHIYDIPIGYSDHTTGIEVPIAGVYAGACVIEKHYTLDRELRGIDWEISANPKELAALVRSVRRAEEILGPGRIEAMPCEEEEVRYRTQLRTIGKAP
jgi:N,N'-diacetyllegionaminate synthase